MNSILILEKTNRLADKIDSKRKEIINVLLDYESYETAMDEINRSLKCLRKIKEIKKYLIYKQINSISTFFPLNLPLYSLILFAVIPALMSDKVFVRPPILMREILKRICKLLEINQSFVGITLIETEKHIFLEGYVSISDVVLFTGRYHNSIKAQKFCPNGLFVYNGAGVNPILITPTANIKLAVRKTIEARCFNSGQDCAGPDTILVHSKIINKFLPELINSVIKIRIGDYYDRKVRIGKIIDSTNLDFISRFLNKYNHNIVYGGNIDFKRSVVFPTIILTSLSEIQNYTEFFSPIFFISTYEKEQDLDLFFQKEEFLDYAMYVSIFGESKYARKIKNSVIIKNQNIMDIEEGNRAYGGYGKKANFVSFNNKYFYRPILIPKEVYEYISIKK